MKVLLVDDEQKFASMLAKRLELRGILVATHWAGEKALAAVQSGDRYEVAILDVKMPGIGGIELKRRLALLDPRMRFVFLTGHGAESQCPGGTDPADECLPKPLNIEDLLEVLHRLTGSPP